ncbi:TIGR01621 family pseudouridine synthase [Alteromonas sp. AMM-1]|uniref:TIGR01621 family pseudouridine synthase n=1 Tax=Alteromonas sp. AMM-1 TaxID=3394233 RepID=UPI0039A6F65F
MNILFSHPDFIVINKPPGITMHDPQHGVVQCVEQTHHLQSLHLVHRLDDGTSGCLILATNAQAAAHFEVLFRTHQVQKYYLALSDKKPKKKQGSIIGDMKNRRNGQHILLKSRENPAITQFHSVGFEGAPRAFIVRPLSGKTHQIRVALKSLGSPILGDTLYAGSNADRMYLHAWGIAFSWHGKAINVFCSPEHGNAYVHADFSAWLSQQPNPATLTWPAVPGKSTTPVKTGPQ